MKLAFAVTTFRHFLENTHTLIKETLLWSWSNMPKQITGNKMLRMHGAAEKPTHLGFKIIWFFAVVDTDGVTLSQRFNRITGQVSLMAAKKELFLVMWFLSR